MFVERPPCPALAPWVKRLWLGDEPGAPGPARRERLVPTGGFHLVLRLDDSRIRIFDGPEDEAGQTFTAVVAAARPRFHMRQALPGARAVGVQLHPGGAGVVLGVPAAALAQRHTALDDLWGPAARRLRAQLAETPHPGRQLALLEQALLGRLAMRFDPHPAVREALARFGSDRTGWQVDPVRRDTGLSHRRFVQLFRRHVGLGPKQLCRVLRLGRVLRQAGPAPDWARLAAAGGYSDQSHLVREFRSIAGVAPGEWAALAGRHAHHVPVVRFVQDRRGRAIV